MTCLGKARAPAIRAALGYREKSEAAKGGERPRRKMASKESKQALRDGGRARPWHSPAKGANWREEQGAGLDARLGARLEGACAGRGLLARQRAASISGAGRGAEG